MSTSIISLRILKIIGVFLVFLLTLEMCARIEDLFRYAAPLWKEYSSDSLKRVDNEGIPYNIANARFQKWQNNGYGFRGPEILPIKSQGTVRVVCLGASESYGLYESFGKEWPAQLSSLLPEPKYQIINVSVVGLGLSSYEAYLKKHVLVLQPDIIICLVNPFFYAAGFEKRQNIQGATSKTGIKTTTKKNISLASIITANSRCLPKLKQVFKQALQNSFPEVLKRYQMWDLQRQIDAAEMAHLGGRQPNDLVSAASVKSFSSDLSKFVSFLESRQIKVLLCTYPALISRNNLSKYPDVFMDNRRFFIRFSLIGMLDILEKYNAAIKAVAVEHKAMFADCHMIVPKTDQYFGDNVHYTDHGARMVAEVIAGQLLGNLAMPVSVSYDNVINLP